MFTVQEVSVPSRVDREPWPVLDVSESEMSRQVIELMFLSFICGFLIAMTLCVLEQRRTMR